MEVPHPLVQIDMTIKGGVGHEKPKNERKYVQGTHRRGVLLCLLRNKIWPVSILWSTHGTWSTRFRNNVSKHAIVTQTSPSPIVSIMCRKDGAEGTAQQAGCAHV